MGKRENARGEDGQPTVSEATPTPSAARVPPAPAGAAKTSPAKPSPAKASPAKTSLVAWQGWQLRVPDRWSPVKLDGDFRAGYVLFADLTRPRLGLRWQIVPRRGKGQADPAAWMSQWMRQEVGALAAAEAEAGVDEASSKDLSANSEVILAENGGGEGLNPLCPTLLYLEPEPPGRDVWIGYGRATGRAVQVVYHAHRRERILADWIVPTAREDAGKGPRWWSIFELSCQVPAGMGLVGQRLNAGDLSLRFAEPGRGRMLVVRQVAVAQLALQRLPLDGWLAQAQRQRHRNYRPIGEAEAASILAGAAIAASRPRELVGWSRASRRRRRFFWKWQLPREWFTLALHDAARDRLILLESNDPTLARTVAATVGGAGESARES